MKKLTIIGGGSVRAVFFAHGLAKRALELGISQLCLFDIDADKLQTIGTLARYAAQQVEPTLDVVLETDAVRAITGAAYFVTTIRVGGDHSRVVDEEIAAAHSVLGQETTGAGGFFMAARSIPVLEGYCEMIRELSPDAWIFNFTNPSGLVTQALRARGFDRVIGICDTPSSTKLRIAEALGVPNESLYLEFFGLNHLSWAGRAVLDGRDVTKELMCNEQLPQKVGELAMFDADLIRRIGHIPNEYLYYYYYRDRVCENIRAAGNTRGKSVEANNKEMLEALGRVDLENCPAEGLRIYLKHMFRREDSYMSIETTKKVLHTPDALVMPDTSGYAGVAMDFIAALESSEGTNIILSVPNENSIEGLRADDVVEITCRVSKAGPRPVKIGAVDEAIFPLICGVKAFERLSVQAIREKSMDLAVKAFLAHPLIGAYGTAKGLVEDFAMRHSAYAQGWK